MPWDLGLITEAKFNSYEVADNIILFAGNTQVIFPISMETQIESIYHNPEKFRDVEGVFVHDMEISSIENKMTDPCPSWTTDLSCTDSNGSSTGDKRISGTLALRIRYTGDNTACESYTYNYKFEYNIQVRSTIKKWWGLWGKNHIDLLEFGTGWGVEYDMPPGPSDSSPCTNFNVNKQFCSGTGWTQETWEIKFVTEIDANSYSSETSPLCGEPQNIRWLYNWADFTNTETTGVACEIACFNDFCE